MNVNLNHVAVFVAVVEAGSFTAAGEALGLPKSSVSRTVAKLEEELGIRLLARTTRSLHLTEAGRAYYDRARNALSTLDEAAAAAAEDVLEPRGVVRVTASAGVGSDELAFHLADFVRRHPQIHIELSLTGRTVDLMEEGFDLAVRGGTLEDSDLVARTIGATDFGIFASRAYLAEFGAPASLEELRARPCVLYKGRAGRTTWKLSDVDGTVTSVEVRGPINVDETLFVRQAVEAGAGIGILPLVVLAPCQRAGHLNTLVRVLPEYAVRGGALYLVTPPLDLVPQRVRLLRDFLYERLSEAYAQRSEEPCPDAD